MYDRNELVWRTQDNKDILIKDLSTPHLVNILNWIKSKPLQYKPELFAFMEEEANFRIISAFTLNQPIPVKQDDGFYITSNISKYELAKSNFYKYKAQFVYAVVRKFRKIRSVYRVLKLRIRSFISKITRNSPK